MSMGIPPANGATHASGHANDHSHTNGTSNGVSKEAFIDGNVAISANTPELVPGLVDQVASLGKVANLQDHKERSALLDAARSLVYALETPREAMIRYCWSQVGCRFCQGLAFVAVTASNLSFIGITVCRRGDRC